MKQNSLIIPFTSENIQYKPEHKASVTKYTFKSIQDRVACIARQQRVIVELFSGCLVATAYIPKETMKKVFVKSN